MPDCLTGGNPRLLTRSNSTKLHLQAEYTCHFRPRFANIWFAMRLSWESAFLLPTLPCTVQKIRPHLSFHDCSAHPTRPSPSPSWVSPNAGRFPAALMWWPNVEREKH